jgi:hypothetical protein
MKGKPTSSDQVAVFHLSHPGGRARWHAKGREGWSANVPGGSKVEITW